MANLYRKKSLQKLSSPEQLDRLIVINSPLVWIALLGGAFIIVVTLLWSILGRVPITEEGQGIILRSGNLTSVYSKTRGVVTKAHVTSGSQVKEGDVLYEVNSEEVAEAVKQLEERIAAVDKITLESTDDEATADSQTLLEVKAELTALGDGNALSGISLADLEQRQQDKQAEVDNLAAALSAAEANYYNALGSDDSAAREYDYSTAASAYEAAETRYQTAAAQYQGLEAEADGYQAKWQEYQALYEQDKTSETAAAALSAAQEYKTAYQTARAGLREARIQRNDAEQERDQAQADFEAARADYQNYIGSSGGLKAEATQLANEYSQALAAYNSAKAELDSYGTQIKNSQTQSKVDSESQSRQRQQLQERFETSREIILERLNQEKSSYDTLQEGALIRANASGTVYSTYAANGSQVTVDSEVARINTDTEDKMYAVYYLDLGTGKNVKPGMKVNIYPTNVSKEEYGHMEGEVTSVANYVTSAADLITKLGDETLAATFTQNGAVVEITCEISTDPSTASGFYWSSRKGADLELTEGTLLEGSVITDNTAPITMLIPKLKEILSLE